MAGMGIRALELARALGGEFDVRLLVGNSLQEAAAAALPADGPGCPPWAWKS